MMTFRIVELNLNVFHLQDFHYQQPFEVQSKMQKLFAFRSFFLENQYIKDVVMTEFVIEFKEKIF